LIAARVRAARRPPSPGEDSAPPPYLRLANGNNSGDVAARPEQETSSVDPTQIQALMVKLQGVVRTAEIGDCRNVAEIRLLQDCIDATVDAISLLVAGLGADDRRKLVSSGSQDVACLRTGGRYSLAKATTATVRRMVDRALAGLESAFGLNQPWSVDALLAGTIAQANVDANASAVNDAEFARQISQLTQLDVLSQTSGQHSRPARKKTFSILEIDPND